MNLNNIRSSFKITAMETHMTTQSTGIISAQGKNLESSAFHTGFQLLNSGYLFFFLCALKQS